MNSKAPGRPALQVTIAQPTPNEVAVCRQCGAAYWLETKIIAVKPSMLVGQGQQQLEKPGIIICGCCLAPAILPWLTYGESQEIAARQKISEAVDGETVQQDQT